MSVHTQSMGPWGPRCDECEQPWPCRTLLVRALAASQERVRALREAAQNAVDRCGNEDCGACGPLRAALAADAATEVTGV